MASYGPYRHHLEKHQNTIASCQLLACKKGRLLGMYGVLVLAYVSGFRLHTNMFDHPLKGTPKSPKDDKLTYSKPNPNPLENLCEPWSKLLASPLITLIVIPYKPPFKEFRLKLMWPRSSDRSSAEPKSTHHHTGFRVS